MQRSGQLVTEPRLCNVSGRDTESEIKNVVEIDIQRHFLLFILSTQSKTKLQEVTKYRV